MISHIYLCLLAVPVSFLCRWENPLIGWTSTADPLDNVGRATLNFHTQADAEAFCQKHGWKYEVSCAPLHALPQQGLGCLCKQQERIVFCRAQHDS